jgi:beta-lactamase regulating signal transducer with metallopeptidase domain
MTESIQHVAQFASAALVSSIWQGALLAALAWLCLKLAPRAAAGVRFGIWSAVFAAVVALPFVAILAGHGAAPAAPSQAQATAPLLLLDPRWAIGIAAIWAAAAAARLSFLAGNALKLRALWSSSSPVALTPALQSILARPGSRGATLCASTEIDQPCAIGFFAPRILLPDWLLDAATPAELEQIVLHESAHLRRCDDWTNLAQKLATACFPLNPALLWIERRLCAERELACDESVVRATRAPRDYAECLAHLAEQRLVRRTHCGALSLGAWERRSQLAGRVESILLGKNKLGPRQARALALSLTLATVGGALKLGEAPQLVSFASATSNPAFAQANPPGANLPATGTVRASRAFNTPGPRYQNVVFHPAPSFVPDNDQTAARPTNPPLARPDRSQIFPPSGPCHPQFRPRCAAVDPDRHPLADRRRTADDRHRPGFPLLFPFSRAIPGRLDRPPTLSTSFHRGSPPCQQQLIL